jgi:aspartyl-tRNA(Asn)/glutamyl-tRNA(Gln) amidotransferase subunit C
MTVVPAPLSEDDVRHVAKLARLSLSDAEVVTFTEQLRSVLDHAADVEALDLDGVLPTAHPLEISNVLRADEIRESLERAEVFAAAPRVADNRFSVPKIVGDAP